MTHAQTDSQTREYKILFGKHNMVFLVYYQLNLARRHYLMNAQTGSRSNAHNCLFERRSKSWSGHDQDDLSSKYKKRSTIHRKKDRIASDSYSCIYIYIPRSGTEYRRGGVRWRGHKGDIMEEVRFRVVT